MSGRRLAVVVTVEHHDDPVLRRYAVPSADVRSLAAVLGDPALGGFDVEFLQDPETWDTYQRLQALCEGRTPDDTLLVYFRGILLSGPGGGLYLATPDTVMQRPADSAVDVTRIDALMHRSQAGQIVIVLDGRTGGPVDAGAYFPAARSAESRSRVVITAAARPEPPTFAGLLADGIRGGAADRDRDGFIGIDEVFDHLRERDPTVRHWVYGSGRQPFVAKVRRPGSDQMAMIAELAAAAAGPDLNQAAQSRTTLSRMATGNDRVAAAASAALRRTSLRAAQQTIDFGRVAPGTQQLTVRVGLSGPPLLTASTVTTAGEGLHAKLEGDQLRVSWFPTVGRLAGTVTVDGPAGSVQLSVTGEVSENYEESPQHPAPVSPAPQAAAPGRLAGAQGQLAGAQGQLAGAQARPETAQGLPSATQGQPSAAQAWPGAAQGAQQAGPGAQQPPYQVPSGGQQPPYQVSPGAQPPFQVPRGGPNSGPQQAPYQAFPAAEHGPIAPPDFQTAHPPADQAPPSGQQASSRILPPPPPQWYNRNGAPTPTSGPPDTHARPTSGAPTSGVPTSGVPTSGIPTSGAPASGVPTSGAPNGQWPGSPALSAPVDPWPDAPTSNAPSSGALPHFNHPPSAPVDPWPGTPGWQPGAPAQPQRTGTGPADETTRPLTARDPVPPRGAANGPIDERPETPGRADSGPVGERPGAPGIPTQADAPAWDVPTEQAAQRPRSPWSGAPQRPAAAASGLWAAGATEDLSQPSGTWWAQSPDAGRPPETTAPPSNPAQPSTAGTAGQQAATGSTSTEATRDLDRTRPVSGIPAGAPPAGTAPTTAPTLNSMPATAPPAGTAPTSAPPLSSMPASDPPVSAAPADAAPTNTMLPPTQPSGLWPGDSPESEAELSAGLWPGARTKPDASEEADAAAEAPVGQGESRAADEPGTDFDQPLLGVRRYRPAEGSIGIPSQRSPLDDSAELQANHQPTYPDTDGISSGRKDPSAQDQTAATAPDADIPAREDAGIAAHEPAGNAGQDATGNAGQDSASFSRDADSGLLGWPSAEAPDDARSSEPSEETPDASETAAATQPADIWPGSPAEPSTSAASSSPWPGASAGSAAGSPNFGGWPDSGARPADTSGDQAESEARPATNSSDLVESAARAATGNGDQLESEARPATDSGDRVEPAAGAATGNGDQVESAARQVGGDVDGDALRSGTGNSTQAWQASSVEGAPAAEERHDSPAPERSETTATGNGWDSVPMDSGSDTLAWQASSADDEGDARPAESAGVSARSVEGTAVERAGESREEDDSRSGAGVAGAAAGGFVGSWLAAQASPQQPGTPQGHADPAPAEQNATAYEVDSSEHEPAGQDATTYDVGSAEHQTAGQISDTPPVTRSPAGPWPGDPQPGGPSFESTQPGAGWPMSASADDPHTVEQPGSPGQAGSAGQPPGPAHSGDAWPSQGGPGQGGQQKRSWEAGSAAAAAGWPGATGGAANSGDPTEQYGTPTSGAGAARPPATGGEIAGTPSRRVSWDGPDDWTRDPGPAGAPGNPGWPGDPADQGSWPDQYPVGEAVDPWQTNAGQPGLAGHQGFAGQPGAPGQPGGAEQAGGAGQGGWGGAVAGAGGWPQQGSPVNPAWPTSPAGWPNSPSWQQAGAVAPPASGSGPYPENRPPSRRRLRVAGVLVVALLLAAGAYLGIRYVSGTKKDEPTAQPTVTQQQQQPGAGQSVAPPQSAEPTRKAPASLAVPVVVDTISGVGREPEGVVVSPDNRTIYVADQGAKEVFFIDPGNKKIASVAVPNTPRFLALSADGSRLYVSMFENDFSANAMAVIDTAKRSLIRSVKTGPRPFEPGVAPDGRVWLPIHNGARVEIYDGGTLDRVSQISVPPNPHWVDFSPDGTRAFTSDHESSRLSVIDAKTQKVLSNISVGRSPHSVAVTPDGKTVVVTNYDVNTVETYDTTTLKLVKRYSVGKLPQAVLVSPDGVHAYVVNEGSDTVSVLDLAEKRVAATIKVGDSPRVVALSPDGLRIYVTAGRDGAVTVLKAAEG
jgi:YVTN family beta-propeller protein